MNTDSRERLLAHLAVDEGCVLGDLATGRECGVEERHPVHLFDCGVVLDAVSLTAHHDDVARDITEARVDSVNGRAVRSNAASIHLEGHTEDRAHVGDDDVGELYRASKSVLYRTAAALVKENLGVLSLIAGSGVFNASSFVSSLDGPDARFVRVVIGAVVFVCACLAFPSTAAQEEFFHAFALSALAAIVVGERQYFGAGHLRHSIFYPHE
jgi:hypothetical protein